MKNFNRASVKQLNQEIENALQVIAVKHNVIINIGNTRFSDQNFSTKIEVAVKSESGTTMTREAQTFEQYKHIYPELSDKELGYKFQSGRKVFTLVGLNPRASKNPVLVTSEGKTYRMPLYNLKVSKSV